MSGTNPNRANTDGDGFLDAYETLLESDPEDFSDPAIPE